jgi:hypothetical protein
MKSVTKDGEYLSNDSTATDMDVDIATEHTHD